MKKTTLLLVMLLMSVFSFAQEQTTITWESSSLPETDMGQAVTNTITLADGYTLKFGLGLNEYDLSPVYALNGDATEIRMYGGNTMTFEGKNIVKITFYGTNSTKKAELSASVGEFEDATAMDKVWTGKTDELTLTNIETGQYRFNKIELTYEEDAASTNPLDNMVVTPAQGEVEALSMITLSFGGAPCRTNEDALIIISKDENYIGDAFAYTNDEGTEIYIEEVESARFTEPGNYTFVVVDGLYVNDQEIPGFTLEYTIPAQSVDPMSVISITPAEGEVESLENFTISFTGITGITVNEDALVTLTKEGSEDVVDGGLMCEDGTNVEVGLMDRVSAYGKYTLNIPAGAITVNGTALDPLAFKYTIKDPNAKEYTIDPVEGKVESLQNFTITFDGYAEVNDSKIPVLTNTTTGTSVEGGITDAAGKVLVYFSDPITEEGEYTLTIPSGAVMIWAIGKMYGELTFNYTIGDPQSGEDEDKLVELPAGVTPEKWYGGGIYMYYGTGGWTPAEIDETFNYQVAFDGNDVYIAGLDVNHEDAWVKGTLENGIITCEPTFTGVEEYNGEEMKYYIIATESVSPYGVKPVQFTYDAEAGIIKVVDGIDITLAPDHGESGSLYAYYDGITITRDAPAADEVVVLPAGVETVDYTFSGNDLTLDNYGTVTAENPFSTTVKVGIDGNDIYVQGINKDYIPEAWVKGVRDGNTVTFAMGQFMGEFMYMGTYGPYKNYLVGTQLGVFNVQDVVMTVDDENGTMTAADAVVINGNKSSISYFNVFSDVVLTNPNVNGISEVNTDDNNAVYFDTMGRRVDANAKGLLIKQVRTSNGVKTMKVVK
ncbi:MAG: hypothetical protein J6M54_03430 [Prevotella sp.]|nr:hypothetical protein [Prevotella sp.]